MGESKKHCRHYKLESWGFRVKVEMLNDEEKAKFVSATLARGSFLRKISVWPPSDIYYEEWLSNFESLDDRYIASKILNNFLYYSKSMVAKLLHDAVGNAISLIARKVCPSDMDFYKKEIFYSYIPGETPNPTDSGLLFMRKLREDLHIPQSRTLMFDAFKALLEDEGTKKRLLLVLCDDFVGSGCQCEAALANTKLKNHEMTIMDFVQKFGHVIAYAPLIANSLGVQRIKNQLPDLILSPAHVLGDEYNLFSEKCICWEGDSDLYRAGVELIRRVSGKLGIKDTPNGVVSVEGFGRQGLFVGFEHGIPDSDPAFFFYSEKGWKPLMRRYCERD